MRRARARRRIRKRLLALVERCVQRRNVLLMMTTAAVDALLTVKRTMWIHHQVCNYWEQTLYHPNCRPMRWIEDLRMNKETFEFLADRLHSSLERANTTFRKAMSYRKKVAMTLWRLATDCSYWQVGRQFSVGRSTACEVFKEVCTAFVIELLNEYITWPTGQRLQVSDKETSPNVQVLLMAPITLIIRIFPLQYLRSR